MNKQILIDLIAHEVKTSKANAERMVNVFTDVITNELTFGQDVTIKGFGTFSRQWRKERNGVNPHNGVKMSIPGTFYPKFKPGREMKEMVKNGKT